MSGAGPPHRLLVFASRLCRGNDPQRSRRTAWREHLHPSLMEELRAGQSAPAASV